MTHHKHSEGHSLEARDPLSHRPVTPSQPRNACECTVTLPLQSPGFAFAEAALRASIPNASVSCIQEVQNPQLLAEFEAFVQEQQPNGVSVWGFHGTGCECCRGGHKAIQSIPQQGFQLGKGGRIFLAAKALYVDLGFASKTADGKYHQMILCQAYCAPCGLGGWECCSFCWNNGPTATVTATMALLPRYVITYNCGH